MKSSARSRRLTLRETLVFALLGALMFVSKLLMEVLPNIHLLGMFTVLLALAYRAKGLIPLYLYVFLDGAFRGFDLWWLPYLYIWTLLWGAAMLLPKRLPLRAALFACPLLCALHGLLFGALYAPAQALMFGFGRRQMFAWIAAGLPFDALHAVGNLAAGCLVIPLWKLLSKIDPSARKLPWAVSESVGDIGDIGNVGNTDSAGSVENTGNTDNPEGTGSVESVGNTDSPEGAGGVENSENTDSPKGAGSAGGVENSERTGGVERHRGRRKLRKSRKVRKPRKKKPPEKPDGE